MADQTSDHGQNGRQGPASGWRNLRRRTVASGAAQPSTEWIKDLVDRDARGFILTCLDLLRDGKPPKYWPLERDPSLLETYMDQGSEQEVDIQHGLENTLTMLRDRLKHGVEVKLDFDRSLPRVWAHGSELNQVWTNLIDNAIDAMNGKGELRIRTARELERVLVEIADNGPGIPSEIRDHIFEPFFTTKGVGKGIGLGLDTARRIVSEHGGEISVDSAPGSACFQVRLPIHR
jgi:signal transduction histidine kinase